MRTKSAPKEKLVRETKKSAANYVELPRDTVIDVVAHTPGGKVYIFEMLFGSWLKMPKKPGFKYSAYQKGFASFPDAIRTNY